MKRNLTIRIMSAIMLSASMIAGGTVVFAGRTWDNLSRQTSTTPVESTASPRESLSPTQKMRLRKGLPINPGALVEPSQTGILPTPKINQRPTSIRRSPSNPRGNFYGVVNRHLTMEVASDAFLAKINAKTGNISKVLQGAYFCTGLGFDYLTQTAAYANGTIVSPGLNFWNMIDMASGDLTDVISFPISATVPYSLTYNPKENKFYMLGFNNMDGRYNIFAVVDPEADYRSLEMMCLSDILPGEEFCAIVYCEADDNLYVFSNFNNVYRINPYDDSDPIFVGEIEYDAIFTDGETGAICYSPADEAFVALYPDNFQQSYILLYINPKTWEVTEGPVVARALQPHFAALFVTDEYAEADAPELPGEPAFDFDGPALSGSMSFMTPSFTYSGISLEGSQIRTVVSVNGSEIFDEIVNPGESISIPLSLSEGYHAFDIKSFIGDKAGPTRHANFFVGYDQPSIPSNITLSENTLTWDAPLKGAHNGYIDLGNLSYDVYIDNVKQNLSPLASTKFTLTPPSEMGKYDISVTATSNGKTSEKASISEIYGRAFDLPFAQAPTQQEQKLYRRINSNNDERKFVYGTYDNIKHNFVMELGYQNDADDWLVFPLINFPSKDYLYSFKFNLAGVVERESIESFGIYLAKKPQAKDLLKGINIYSENYYRSSNDQFLPMEINFAVNEPGDYYVGIHVNSTKSVNPSGMGLQFADFDISVCEGKSTILPADPTKVEIIPNETGDTEFDAKVTISTLDIAGNPLPADMDITITVSADGFARSVTGKPGQTVELNKIPVNGSGFTNISVTPSNDNGKGYTRSHRAYVGIDIPFCPTDIKGSASADNRSINVSWKAPGAIGENGGTVRLDELSYNFYAKSGITFVRINSDPIIDTQFTFAPFSMNQNNPARQSTYYIGPSAVTVGGESRNSMFIMSDLGDPYELPMKEEWNTTGFTYSPAHYLTTGTCINSVFESRGAMDSGEVGSLTFNEGGIVGYSGGASGDGKYIVPKFSTKGIEKSIFKLRFWDYSQAINEIQIYGTRFGDENEKFIGEFKLNHPAKGEWVEAEIPLPAEFNNADWVQLYVGCHFTAKQSEYIILDSYEIFPDIDYDLKLNLLEGPTEVSVGDNPTYNVQVANSGRERIPGKLTIELVDDKDNIFASEHVKIDALAPSQIFEHNSMFELTGEVRDHKNLYIRASVETDNDQNSNNNRRILPVSMMGSQLPVVSDLKAAVNNNDCVDLEWSTPELAYGDFINFDAETPFLITDKIGRFSNYDLDNLYPIEIGSGILVLEWEGSRLPQGWTVVNIATLGLMNDERMRAHSGEQVLMARPVMELDGTAGRIQAADFLVSPKIIGGTKVSWWESTMATDTEYVEVWYATKENPVIGSQIVGQTICGDFKKLVSRSKGGAETWEYIEAQLPANATHFALRYASYDGTAVLIDDLRYSPAELAMHDLNGYSIYRSQNNAEPTLVADNLLSTKFTDNDWNNDFNAEYFVVTSAMVNNEIKNGPKSNVVLVKATGIDEIPADASIIAGDGYIRVNNLRGEKLNVASTDGKIVISTIITDNQSYFSLHPGVYIVSAADITVKVIVR